MSGSAASQWPPPVVTVAMPVYNGGIHLRAAVTSIVQQTFGDWELLLIDDGSTDGALESLADLADPRIRVLRDGDRRGIAVRLNQAIDLARGRYLARMDADDISFPERFAKQLAMLQADSGLDLLATRAVTVDDWNQITGSFPHALLHDEICIRPWRGFHFPHPTWMGKTAWFRAHRYAVPAPYLCEDQELLLRSHAGSRFGTVDEILLAYRVNAAPNWRRLAKIRRATAQYQLRHFLRQGPWYGAAMALLAWLAKTGRDAWNRVTRSSLVVRTSLVSDETRQRWLATLHAVDGSVQMPGKKLCLVATIPAVVHAFLRGHIQAAAESYQVTVVCNAADPHLLEGLNARRVLLPIERKPSVWKDLAALLSLWRLFRQERFDIVHSHMPKTGLLGMLAARAAGVPVRIHTFHGEVWATRSGLRRLALKRLDQLVAWLATHVLTVSPSQRAVLVKERVVPQGKAGLIGSGSICGVDPQRFRACVATRNRVRDGLHIARDDTVILFVGRLNHDKGMLDLAHAFNTIASARQDVVLLLVGAQEDVPFSQMQTICHAWRDRLRHVPFTPQPEHYMAAADLFCLPSYREGLPMTILEAACCGLPTVASRIYGITDAVVDGETGLLFEAGDVRGLAESLLTLIATPAMRQQYGQAARERTVSLFSNTAITRGVVALYDRLSAPTQQRS